MATKTTSPKDKEVQSFADLVLTDEELDMRLIRHQLRSPESVPEREDQYFDFHAVSNSDLKLLSKHPQYFLEEKILEVEQEEEDKSHFKLGNMIETKLLCPGVFSDLFVQEPPEMKSPSSGKQKDFCQLVIGGHTPEEAFRETYSTKRKSDEKIAEKAQSKHENLQDFINLQREVEESGKTPYSPDDMMTTDQAIMSARKHDQIPDLLSPTDGEIKVQHPLAGQLENLAGESLMMKGLADWIVVKDDKIISVDLKTTSKPLNSFPYHYHKYHYYRQQGLYYSLLRDEYSRPVETKCVVLRTREPFGARVYDIPSDLIRTGIREIRALAKRLVVHLSEDFDFESPLEDQMPSALKMAPKEDMLDRHLEQARIQSNGRP
jgi:hypothetical protein